MVDDELRDAIQTAFSSVDPTDRLRERTIAIRTQRRRRQLVSAGAAAVALLLVGVIAVAPRDDDASGPLLTGNPANTPTPVWPEFNLGIDGPAQQTRGGDWRHDAVAVA